MTYKLEERAQEGSSFILKATFYTKSSDGSPPAPFVPNEGVTWTLRDAAGQIVNNRQDVSIATGGYVVIVLLPADLMLSDDYPEERYLTVSGTYNNEVANNIPFLDEVMFIVENTVGV